MLRPQLVLTLALALLLAACGGSTATGPVASATTGPSAPASADASASTAPSSSDVVPSGTPSTEPSVSESPSGSTSPSGSAEPSGSPGPSGPVSTADACTGSQVNRDWFKRAAIALPWPVQCGVLPADWFMTGTYQLAAGGQLTVSYKGPGGATIDLSEGAFCADTSGCVPPGTDAGDATLGTQAGTFVTLADGGFAIVVGRGEPLSWLFVAHGLDEATARALGAAVVEVAG